MQFSGLEGYTIRRQGDFSKPLDRDCMNCVRLWDGRLAIYAASVARDEGNTKGQLAGLELALQDLIDRSMPLAKLAMQLNRFLTESSSDVEFITFVIVAIVPMSGEVEILNAGHMSPLIIDEHKVAREIASITGHRNRNVPLLVLDGFPYESESVTLSEGEGILIASDYLSYPGDLMAGFLRSTVEVGTNVGGLGECSSEERPKAIYIERQHSPPIER